MSFQQFTSRRLPIALLAGLALAVIAAVVAFAALGGSADGAKSKVLGKPKGNPGQQCAAKDNKPGNENPSCMVMASVTAVQVQVDGKRNVLKAPSGGKIVAYGVSLGKPQKEFRESLRKQFDGGAFDGRATTQLAILRGGKKGRYKLLRRSKDFNAERFLNREPIVALSKPLRVRKGDFIGLTTPSWLPALGSRGDNRWRGSQKSPSRKKCDSTEVLENSKPLRKVGKSRRFLCTYDDHVLYWAYFQPKGKDGGGGGGNNRVQTLGAAPTNAPAANDLPSGGIAP